ncbi:diguanylate cyclase [Pseudomonas corrugata]
MAQIKHLSLHDPLTGLANRNRLFDCLSEYLDPASGVSLAVLNLDMDRFKPVNDSLGHAVGDKVLKEVAHILQQNVRDSDLVARLGGDEFVIVMPEPGNADDLDQLCGRLIDCMQRPMHLDGNTLYLGVSIGVAWAHPGDSRADELLRQADIALYAAKAAGRNTWRVYVEAMGNVARDRRRYEQQLRDAMHRDQLELRYLPRFDVNAEQLYGFEAQTFWHHPEKGELGVRLHSGCRSVRSVGRVGGLDVDQRLRGSDAGRHPSTYLSRFRRNGSAVASCLIKCRQLLRQATWPPSTGPGSGRGHSAGRPQDSGRHPACPQGSGGAYQHR